MAESVLKILALFAAGAWTYWLILHQRQWFPSANLSLKLTDYTAPDGSGLLLTEASIENTGKTLIRIDRVDSLVQRVLPTSKNFFGRMAIDHSPETSQFSEIQWYRIWHRVRRLKEAALIEIEPGEKETLRFDALIQPVVRTVKVTVHVTNCKKRVTRPWYDRRPRRTEIGWRAVEYYDMKTAITRSTASPSSTAKVND